MNKTVFVVALCLSLFLATTARAQDTLKIQPETKEGEESLQEIDIRELPEIIKQKLSRQNYKSWILQAAFKAPASSPYDEATGENMDYVVELRKDTETIRVRFDRAGIQSDMNEDQQ